MEKDARLQGKRSQAVAEVTRQAMLDAALDAFSDHGYDNTSLRHVADKAKVSHALFRKHFGSKDALWTASVDHGVDRYAKALRASARKGDKPTSTIKDQLRILLELTATHPALVRMMVLEGASGGVRAAYLSEVWHKIGDEHRALFHDAQWDGALTQFIDGDLFLFVLTSGMIPLALPGLANSILREDISTKVQQELHIERLLNVLFK